jgi:formylglycine-generating enzyme required for sulfatase activity
MGSPESELTRALYEGPQTQVTISRGFHMGRYEVTQGE